MQRTGPPRLVVITRVPDASTRRLPANHLPRWDHVPRASFNWASRSEEPMNHSTPADASAVSIARIEAAINVWRVAQSAVPESGEILVLDSREPVSCRYLRPHDLQRLGEYLAGCAVAEPAGRPCRRRGISLYLFPASNDASNRRLPALNLSRGDTSLWDVLAGFPLREPHECIRKSHCVDFRQSRAR